MENEEIKAVFSDFDALAIKERVDAFVSLMEKCDALEQSGGPVRISMTRCLNIESGIQEAAEVLGVELHEHKMESGRFLYRFRYKGYEFHHLSEERLEKHTGETV